MSVLMAEHALLGAFQERVLHGRFIPPQPERPNGIGTICACLLGVT
jgi:hypothetical protein